MAGSILDKKNILAVDDEPDVLTTLEEEILDAAPKCHIDRTTSYQKAVQLLSLYTYDLVILDILGVRGFDLLKRAVDRPSPFPVVMLTAHALNPEALKGSIEMGARAYLPKEELGEIVPFLEDVLECENLKGWDRLLEKLKEFFSSRWGENWKRIDEKFWKELDERIAFIKK